MDDMATVVQPPYQQPGAGLPYDERMCLLLNTAVGIPGLWG